jgi:hypothetical protein
MKKIWLLAVLALCLVPSALAIADSGFQISNEFAPLGLVVDAPKLEYYQLNQNITFNVHVFDAVTLTPMTNLTAMLEPVYCIAHFYNSTGDKIREDILVYDGDFDFYDTITDPLITGIQGRHTYRVWCGVETQQKVIYGGWVSSYFDVTFNGKAPPSAGLIVFFIIAFIAIVAVILYTLVYILMRFQVLDIDPIDIVYCFMAYFALFIIYGMNITYMGNAMIDSLLNVLIVACGLTNMVLPLILFVLAYFKKFAEMKVEIAGGGRERY